MSFGRTRLIGTGTKNRKHLDKFKFWKMKRYGKLVRSINCYDYVQRGNW